MASATRCPGGGSAEARLGGAGNQASGLPGARPREDCIEVEMALGHVGEAVEPGRDIADVGGPGPGRDGVPASPGPRRAAPRRTPQLFPSAAIASATRPRWRSLPTRLSPTAPATRTAGRGQAMPRATAAAVCDWPRDIEHEQHRQAEPRREVGGRAAAAGRPPATPSNSPMTPSMTRNSAASAAPPASASRSSCDIAQLSRLTLAEPVTAAWNAGSM